MRSQNVPQYEKVKIFYPCCGSITILIANALQISNDLFYRTNTHEDHSVFLCTGCVGNRSKFTSVCLNNFFFYLFKAIIDKFGLFFKDDSPREIEGRCGVAPLIYWDN